jgi:cytochrome c oxidase subunit II
MAPAQRALGFSSMHTENFRAALVVVIFSLVYGTLRFSSTLQAAHILDRRDRVDLATLHLRGEFVESNLGAARAADGPVTIHMIAEKYVFVPACVTVPAGVPIRLRITSADSAHGFKIAGSEVKTVPGSVTEIHLRFPAADKYEFYCDEFCGPGHHAMMGRIVAVSENQFQPQKSARGAACGQP